MTEHQAQKALMVWANAQSGAIPQLRLLFAIPNGGLRGKATAGKMKAEGVKRGVPDLLLPVPVYGVNGNVACCGLWIEMKVGKGRLSDHQKWWRDALSSQGYSHVVCYGWEEAKDAILAYLGRRPLKAVPPALAPKIKRVKK